MSDTNRTATAPSPSPRERFRFHSDALDDQSLQVVRFSGQEGLSELYAFDLTLMTRADSLPLADMLASRARLVLLRDDGRHAVFSGYPTRIRQTSRYNDWTFYHLVLQPGFWKYTQIVQNNFFINKSVVDILSACLDSLDSYDISHEFRLSKDYAPQDFSMQNNESLHDYMSWKMERDGIYYYFAEEGQGEHLIFTDSGIAHTALEDTPALRYAPDSGLLGTHREEVVVSFARDCTPLPRRVVLRDYDWLKPNTPVVGSAVVSEDGLGDVYFYGDGFTTAQEGDRLAEIRAEGLRCRANRYLGTGSVPTLRPGFNFTLTNHYDEGWNREYTIVSVRHEGSQEAWLSQALGVPIEHPDRLYYRNSFTCIPADLQFRPERKTVRRKVGGMIPAFIDSSNGTGVPEINDMGCYKVVFPQDVSGREAGKASCWIRRMQPQVGKGYGTVFPLSAGVEVLVAFIDGDPDRPVIAGAVGNPESGLSESSNATQNMGMRSAGGNNLLFNDADAKQGLLLNTGGRSGIMMSSGSLDTYMSYSDFNSKLTSTMGETFSGLAETISGGFESSLSASNEELSGKEKYILAALEMIQKLCDAGSKELKPADPGKASDAQIQKTQNMLSDGLAGGAALIKAGLVGYKVGKKIKKAELTKYRYAASLTAARDESELKIQSAMTDKAVGQYIAFHIANWALAYSSSLLHDHLDARAKAKKADATKADEEKDKTEIYNNYKNIDKEIEEVNNRMARTDLGDVERSKCELELKRLKETKKKLDERDKRYANEEWERSNAKRTLVRNFVQSTVATLLPELLGTILLWKTRPDPEAGSTPRGILLNSPESTLVMGSHKEAMLMSDAGIGLSTYPAALGVINKADSEELGDKHKIPTSTIKLQSDALHGFALHDVSLASAHAVSLESGNAIVISNRPADRIRTELETLYRLSEDIKASDSTTALQAKTTALRQEKTDFAALKDTVSSSITMVRSNGASNFSVRNKSGTLSLCNTPSTKKHALSLANRAYDGGMAPAGLLFCSSGASLSSTTHGFFLGKDVLGLGGYAGDANSPFKGIQAVDLDAEATELEAEATRLEAEATVLEAEEERLKAELTRLMDEAREVATQVARAAAMHPNITMTASAVAEARERAAAAGVAAGTAQLRATQTRAKATRTRTEATQARAKAEQVRSSYEQANKITGDARASIVIETGNGQGRLTQKAADLISLDSEDELRLASAKNARLESRTGALTLKARTNLTIESQNFKVSGEGQVSIKGSIVKIN